MDILTLARSAPLFVHDDRVLDGRVRSEEVVLGLKLAVYLKREIAKRVGHGLLSVFDERPPCHAVPGETSGGFTPWLLTRRIDAYSEDWRNNTWFVHFS